MEEPLITLNDRINEQRNDPTLVACHCRITETVTQRVSRKLRWMHHLRALALLPVQQRAQMPAQALVSGGDLDCKTSEPSAAAAFFQVTGVSVFEAEVAVDLIDACRSAVDAISLEVDAALMKHGLAPNVTLGSSDFAFNEVVRRGRGRLDIRGMGMGAPPLNDERLHGEAPWWPFVRAVLGENAHECFRGIMDNRPGSATQAWHADGPEERVAQEGHDQHSEDASAPAQCITVFVPLVSTSDAACGPTQFFPGSHPYRVRADYHLLSASDHPGQPPFCTPQTERGGLIAFDYRLIHRGTANTRSIGQARAASRPVLYVVYAREGYSDEHNFPTNAPLFDFDTDRARLHELRTSTVGQT